jgi:hypothetical protein
VDACGDEDDWFFEAYWSAFLRKEVFVEYLFFFLLLVGLVVGSDGQEVDVPLVGTLYENLLVEVELVVAVVLIEGSQIFYISGIGVGIGKSELCLVIFVPEMKLKGAFQFASLAQD